MSSEDGRIAARFGISVSSLPALLVLAPLAGSGGAFSIAPSDEWKVDGLKAEVKGKVKVLPRLSMFEI